MGTSGTYIHPSLKKEAHRDFSEETIGVFFLNFNEACLKTTFVYTGYSVVGCCIYIWYDQFLNTLYSFGALTSSRTSAPWRVYKEGHLDLALNQHKGEMPYVDRCKLLKWPSLSDRRNYLSLIECYKFVFGYYHLNFYDFFEFSKVGSTKANHPFKLYVKSARLDCYKYSLCRPSLSNISINEMHCLSSFTGLIIKEIHHME